jgi:cytosine/adenosine deaminase-related metal-dependent hydrolase
MNLFWKGGSRRDPSETGETMAHTDPPAQPRRLTVVPDGSPQATELADTPVLTEAETRRARALRLLAIGVGDHTPAEVREQVAAIARRLAELEPGTPVEWH